MSVPGFELAPRYRELLDRVFGEELEFVPPGVLLDGLQAPRDWAVLRREYAWCVHIQATTGVAIFSGVGIQNPPTSLMLAVVTKVRQRALSGTASVQFSRSPSLLPNYVASAALTPRLQDCRTSRGSAAVAPLDTLQKQAGGQSAIDTAYEFLDAPANGVTIQTPDDWWTALRPGQSLIAESIAANVTVDTIWYGYVRLARPEELQGDT